jgi:TfoX/Sxy family transcriptional regulator of competence genes
VARKYLEQLSALIGRLTSGSLKGAKLECKHFFSGAAVYVKGRICMSWTPAGFALKLPETARNVLMEHHGAKSLRYFPRGPFKQNYVILPKSMLKDGRTLGRLAKTSVAYALSLPAPKKKSRATRG